MNLLREIVEWAQDLPGWQADAVRRLLKQGELDDNDKREALAQLRAKHQLLPKGEMARPEQKPSRVDVSASAAELRDVKLLAVKKLSNVNAIVSDQTLRFGKEGVTVIYGGNASGKSGYARVLKRACRARDMKDTVHPNVFEANPSGQPSAVFDLEISGKEESVSWVEGKACPNELSDIAVFDSRCARIYVDGKNDVSYIPYGMDIFQKLVDLCSGFRAQMLAEQEALITHPAFLDEFDTGTPTGKLVAEVSAITPTNVIEQKAALTREDNRRFQELDEFLKRADVESPKARSAVLRRLKARALKLKGELAPTLRVLSHENVALLDSLQTKAKEKAEVARVASEEAFKDMPLSGVGSNPWRGLFRAAKAYSEAHAYPGQEFPVVEPDSRCVLCHQILDDVAKERFRRFRDFVVNQTAREAEAARRDFESKHSEFQKTMVVTLEQNSELLTEIEERSAELAAELKNLLEVLKPRYDAVGNAIESCDWSSIPALPVPDLAKLETLVGQLEDEAKKNDSLGDPGELVERRREHAELSQRKLVAKYRSEILDLIDCFKRGDRLRNCIKGLNTAGITIKNSKLMDAVTTDALRDALKQEFEVFGIKRLQVSLDKTGSKGITLHQLRLPVVAESKVSLSEILSEGEHCVLAIASFLAELSIVPGRNAIVFDDPVSSLDHEFREKVAKRLIEEGRRRQVIIFTHDIVFLLALERHAVEQDVPLTGQVVRREGSAIGKCLEDLPWAAQNVKKRIGSLRDFLGHEIKQSFGDQDKYSKEVETFYGRLRETWERAVEEVLLNDTLQRFRLGIETHRLKEVSVEDEDYRRVDRGMSKCSTRMTGHDNAPATGDPSSSGEDLENELEELKNDLDELESFIKEIRKRREKTGKSRGELLRPRQG